MAEDYQTVACPFCGWAEATKDYEMLMHMETLHPDEEQEPPADDIRGGDWGPKDINYVECPAGCDAVLELDDLESHLLQVHSGEEEGTLMNLYETREKQSRQPTAKGEREKRRHSDRQSSSNDESRQKPRSAWAKFFGMSSSSHRSRPSSTSKKPAENKQGEEGPRRKRLGMAELGWYAHEERMPSALATYLRKNGQVVSHGIVDVVATLLDQSKQTAYAYVCHPCVQHISRLKYEGGFCGYRNIQMMCSYIIGANIKGHQHFGGKIPSVFDIQEWIEAAWDKGINAEGRIETGGIRGTRKYIGTPEALAMFSFLNIPTDTEAIKHAEPSKAEALLMKSVEDHFQSAVIDPTQRIRRTNASPLYFQHVGHSLTIIGFERLHNGTKQLIVFDPSYKVSSNLVALAGKQFTHPHPDFALRSYRRGTRYLRRFKEFELLRVLEAAN